MTLPVRSPDCKGHHDSTTLVERQPRAGAPDRCANGLLGPGTHGFKEKNAVGVRGAGHDPFADDFGEERDAEQIVAEVVDEQAEGGGERPAFNGGFHDWNWRRTRAPAVMLYFS